jgi:DNA-binding beta-propeller fold protein YncE
LQPTALVCHHSRTAVASRRPYLIGNTGIGGRIVVDADVVTLVDVSKRPFSAVQQISVPSSPEGVAISPDGKWIVVSSMAGSNLTAIDPGRSKLGKVGLYAIRNGQAVKVQRAARG